MAVGYRGEDARPRPRPAGPSRGRAARPGGRPCWRSAGRSPTRRCPPRAPMSAIPTVWNPRPAASWAAAARMRSRRSGSRRHARRSRARLIWSSWQPRGTVATSEPTNHWSRRGLPRERRAPRPPRGRRGDRRAVRRRLLRGARPRGHAVRRAVAARSATPGSSGSTSPRSTAGAAAGSSSSPIVCEEIASQGAPLLLLLVSAAISAEVIGEFGSPELRKEWLPGPRERPHEGRLRDHRAERRLEHPPPGHDGHPRRRRAGCCAARSTTSPASTRRRRCMVVARTGRDDRRVARCSRCSSSPPTRPAWSARRCRST